MSRRDPAAIADAVRLTSDDRRCESGDRSAARPAVVRHRRSLALFSTSRFGLLSPIIGGEPSRVKRC